MFATLESVILDYRQRLRPEVKRSRVQFAEAEIVLPQDGGPRGGQHFRASYMPVHGMVLDIIDSGAFRRVVLSGPAQTGKSLIGAADLQYTVFELNEPYILGSADVDTVKTLYRQKVEPLILKSRFKDLLPTHGAGSKLGLGRDLILRNSATIFFRGAGRGAIQQASITCPHLWFTETDKAGASRDSSDETDPIRGLEARAQAAGRRATSILECTPSTPDGRVWRLIVEGTNCIVYVACPHCGRHVTFAREHLVGWQQAPDEIAAGVAARLGCPECGAAWTEADRLSAIRHPLLVGEGQSVDDQGAIVGPLKPTVTYSVHWSWWAVPWMRMEEVAQKEWALAKTPDRDRERELVQLVWGEPWTEDVQQIREDMRSIVARAIGAHPRGTIPAACRWLTVFIDVGDHTHWWTAWGWTADAQGFLCDWGPLSVPQANPTERLLEKADQEKALSLRVLDALREFRDTYLAAGWRRGDAAMLPDLVLVDSGHQTPMVYQFCRESGVDAEGRPVRTRYRPTKGDGTMFYQDRWHAPAATKDRYFGQNWYVSTVPGYGALIHLHADHWKECAHEGFAAAPGTPGALLLPAGTVDVDFCRQVAGEERVQVNVRGKGMVDLWQKTRGETKNHYLDCCAGARAAAEMLGATTVARPPVAAPAPAPYREERPRWKIGR